MNVAKGSLQIGSLFGEQASCFCSSFAKIRLSDMKVNAKLVWEPNISTVDSLLTDTSVKRTPRVGLCLSLLPLFDSL